MPMLQVSFKLLVLGSAIFQIKTTAGKKRRIPEILADSQVLLEPGQETLPDFLAEHKVHVIASLPSSLDQNGDLKESKRRDF